MAGKLAPINPEVLEWALKSSGLTRAQLSAEAKIPLARFDLICRGSIEPNTGELRAIAKALERPTAFFFLPKPPSRTVTPVSFRSPVGMHGKRHLTSEEQHALRSAGRWQRIASWVRERRDFEKTRFPHVNQGGRPQDAAGQLIIWLSWSEEEQRKTSSAGALLKLLRGRLEDKGILVLQYSLGREGCRGFSMPHPVAPIIALNSTYNAEARVYSLLHELTHLVRGDQAICGDPRDDRVERWCEETAAAFLMPAREVCEYLDRWVTRGLITEVDEVRRLANRYRVSLRAAALRLIQLRRAERSLYGEVNRIAEFGGGGFSAGSERQTTPVIRVRELGSAVPRLLLDARATGLLSDTEVRRYLDVSGDQLEDLKRRVMDPVVGV